MATGTKAYDNSQPTGTITAVPGFAGAQLTVLTRVMNAAEIIADAAGVGLASSTKITAGEEITAFTLPLGFLIFGTVISVTEAGTAGGTINVGTIANTTAYDATVSIATVNDYAGISATDAGAIASGGAWIISRSSTADEIVVEYIADETTGEFIVTVFGLALQPFIDAAK